MTFQELRLCVAIHLCAETFKDAAGTEYNHDFANKVHREHTRLTDDSYFPWTMDEVLRWATNVRKSSPTKVKLEVALAHGFECFWRNRNVGQCDNQVECGHIIANVKGGPLELWNCIIECRAHNNDRRALTIEEYLRKGFN